MGGRFSEGGVEERGAMATLDIPTTKAYIQTQETTAVATVDAKIKQYDDAVTGAGTLTVAKQQKINLVGQYTVKWGIHTDTSAKRDQIIAAVESERDTLKGQVETFSRDILSLREQVNKFSTDLTRKITNAELQTKINTVNTILSPSINPTIPTQIDTDMKLPRELSTTLLNSITTIALVDAVIASATQLYNGFDTTAKTVSIPPPGDTTQITTTGANLRLRLIPLNNRWIANRNIALLQARKAELLTTVRITYKEVNEDLNTILNLQQTDTQGLIREVFGLSATASGPTQTITQAINQVKDLRQQVAGIQQERQAASGALTGATSDAAALRSRIVSLERDSEAASGARASTLARIQGYKAALNQKAAPNTTKVKAVESKAKNVKSRVTSATTPAPPSNAQGTPAAAAMKGGAATTGDPMLDALTALEERVDQREAEFAIYQQAAEAAATAADDTITELNGQVSSLTQDKSNLQGQIDTLTAQIGATVPTTQLTAAQSAATDALNKLKGLIKVITDTNTAEILTDQNIGNAAQRVQSMKQALPVAQATATDAMNKLKILIKDITKKNAANLPNDANIRDARAGIQALEKGFAELQQEVLAFTKESTGQNAANISSALATIRGRVAELQGTLATLQQEVARLQPFEGQAATLQQEVARLQPFEGQAATLQQEVARLQPFEGQAAALQTSYSTAFTALNRLAKEITGNEMNSANPNVGKAANNSLRVVTGLTQKIAELEQTVTTRGTNLSTTEQKRAAAQAAADAAAAQVEQLSQQLSSKTTNAETFQANVGRLTGEVTNLTQQLSQKGVNLGRTEQEKQTLVAAAEEANRTIAALQASEAAKQEQITTLEADAQAAAARATEELERLRANVQAKNAAIQNAGTAAATAAAAANETIEQLRALVATRNANVASKMTNLDAVRAKVTELEALVTTTKNAGELALQTAASNAARSMEQVKVALEQQRRNNVQAEKDKATVAAEEASAAAAAAATEIDTLRKTITKKNSNLNLSQTELTKAEQAASDAAAEIRRLNQLLSSKTANLGRVQSAANSAASRVQELEGIVTQKNSNLARKQQEANTAAAAANERIDALEAAVAAKNATLTSIQEAAAAAAQTAAESVADLERIVAEKQTTLNSAQNTIRKANEAAQLASDKIAELEANVRNKDGSIATLQTAAEDAAKIAKNEIDKLEATLLQKNTNMKAANAAAKVAANAAAAVASTKLQELRDIITEREATLEREKQAATKAVGDATKEIEDLRKDVLAKNGTITSVRTAANAAAAEATARIKELEGEVAEKSTTMREAASAADTLLKQATGQIYALNRQIQEKEAAIDAAEVAAKEAAAAARKEVDRLQGLITTKNSNVKAAEKETRDLMNAAAKKILDLRKQLNEMRQKPAQASVLQELAGLKRQLEEERATARVPSGTVVIPSSDAKRIQDSLTRVVLELRKQSFGSSRSLQKLIAKIVLGLQDKADRSARYQTVKVGGGGDGGKRRRTRRRKE